MKSVWILANVPDLLIVLLEIIEAFVPVNLVTQEIPMELHVLQVRKFIHSFNWKIVFQNKALFFLCCLFSSWASCWGRSWMQNGPRVSQQTSLHYYQQQRRVQKPLHHIPSMCSKCWMQGVWQFAPENNDMYLHWRIHRQRRWTVSKDK